jgi:hypothetical protein
MKPIQFGSRSSSVQFEVVLSQFQMRSECSEAARSMQTRQRIGTTNIEEYKRSAGEELTQCDYSNTENVIVNYNSA